jgi:hypothetical protein
MIQLKKCPKCLVEKPLSDFYFSVKKGKPCYSTYCRECELAYRRERRQGPNGDKVRERERKYRELNKEKINAENRERYQKHHDRYMSYKKKWRENHREDYLRQAKETRLRHLDRVKAYKKKYNQENKDKKKKWDKKYRESHKEHRNAYQRNRMENDALFRLKHQIGSLVRQSLKKKGYKKDSKTSEIIGCDYETLLAHLKKTWVKNYGFEWNGETYQIDHIIPLAVAKTEKDVIDLFYYTNLQMLTPDDNLEKRAKLDWKLDNQL